MELAIVIVNYQSAGLVLDCLASIDKERRCAIGDIRAVIVDNASGDGSAEKIYAGITARGWTSWATLVQSKENGGFGAGNNIGIGALDSPAYLLLNSDTVVQPGLFDGLTRAVKAHPEAGIIGPCLQWPDGAPQVSRFRWPQPRSELVRSAASNPVTRLMKRADVPLPVVDKATTEVEWVSFAAVLIRSDVIQQVGPLDEGYFMFFEDVDYCRRAREAGWQILYWPEARVTHLRGGTSPVKALSQARKRRPTYYYESRARYYKKFYGLGGLWRANLYWMLGRCVSLCREWVEKKPRVACDSEWRDNWTDALKPSKNRAHAESRS